MWTRTALLSVDLVAVRFSCLFFGSFSLSLSHFPLPHDPVLPHCCTHHYVSHWDPPLTPPRVYTWEHTHIHTPANIHTHTCSHIHTQVPVTGRLTINKADTGSKTQMWHGSQSCMNVWHHVGVQSIGESKVRQQMNESTQKFKTSW